MYSLRITLLCSPLVFFRLKFLLIGKISYSPTQWPNTMLNEGGRGKVGSVSNKFRERPVPVVVAVAANASDSLGGIPASGG